LSALDLTADHQTIDAPQPELSVAPIGMRGGRAISLDDEKHLDAAPLNLH
jgi:hypothetical protein